MLSTGRNFSGWEGGLMMHLQRVGEKKTDSELPADSFILRQFPLDIYVKTILTIVRGKTYDT